MERIQLLNSDSTSDITEVQHHEEAPKDLRSLPRELRDKIYKLVLLPEPHCTEHCTVQYLSGAQLASTCPPAKTQKLCMDITRICGRAVEGASSTSKLDETVSILLACRQIFREASQVLYENTELHLKPDCWPFSVKVPAVDQSLIDCPTYALHHIRAVSLAFFSTRKDITFYGLDLVVDRLRLPNLRLIKFHFDMDTETPDATHFGFFYAIADHVEFVVDVHINSTFHDDGTGWAVQLWDNGWDGEGNQEIYAAAWAAAKEEAFAKRAAFVKELGKIFQTHGKELKVKEN